MCANSGSRKWVLSCHVAVEYCPPRYFPRNIQKMPPRPSGIRNASHRRGYRQEYLRKFVNLRFITDGTDSSIMELLCVVRCDPLRHRRWLEFEQSLQKCAGFISNENERAMLSPDESFSYRVIDLGQKWIVKSAHVEQARRLHMETQLSPRDDFAEFF